MKTSNEPPTTFTPVHERYGDKLRRYFSPWGECVDIKPIAELIKETIVVDEYADGEANARWQDKNVYYGVLYLYVGINGMAVTRGMWL